MSGAIQIRNRDKLFIGGQWLPAQAGRRIELVNPATEEVFTTVAEAGEADMDRAVAAAREAFDHGPWPRMTHAERGAKVAELARLLEARHAELAAAWTLQMGGVASFAPNVIGGGTFRPVAVDIDGTDLVGMVSQGDIATTPLQIAVVYAAIANGGRLWAPTVADALVRPDGTVVQEVEPTPAGSISLGDDVLGLVREGLNDVITQGTAAGAFAGWPQGDFPLAGKTGSAESFGREATSWFASYGPTTDPEYVVVVVVEEGGLGATTATPAARQIWDVLRTREATD